MKRQVFNWLSIKYPQNYIVKNPLIGTIIIGLFVFGFTVLYKPFNTHPAKTLSFETTMAFYSSLSSVFLFVFIKILKSIKYFSKSNEWTVGRELLSVLIVLFALGIAIYLLGFIMEPSAPRW